MKTILQGIPMLSVFVFGAMAGNMMDTYGIKGFLFTTAVWALVAGAMVLASFLFPDNLYKR